MTPLVLFVAGGFLASLPMAMRRVGRRLAAAEWAWLCLVAVVGSVVLIELALLVWAAPVVFAAMGLDDLAVTCTEMLGPFAAGGRLASAAAGVAAVVLVAGMVWRWRRLGDRAAALCIEPGLGRHQQRDGFDLVVLPTDEPLAYCVTRPDAQVVVSEGLVRRLPADEFAAVVAHERAHLDQHHDRFLRLAATAAAALTWWPPAARSHAVLRSAIERWADDAATRGDRWGREALRAALMDVATLEPPHGVPALSLAAATAERVEALEGREPAPRPVRLGAYVPGALIGTTVAAALFSCASLITSSLQTLRECCAI